LGDPSNVSAHIADSANLKTDLISPSLGVIWANSPSLLTRSLSTQ